MNLHYPRSTTRIFQLIIFLAFFLANAAAFADSIVSGRVSDSTSGRSLESADVRISELGRRVTTDSSGSYRFVSVPAGEYTLNVSYVGYETESVQVSVTDKDAATVDVALASMGTTEEVLVTGFRASQLSSVQDKNASDLIKDSITANDAGKLPDANAAEALQRVPGVSITIDQGEGRYVTIRGIDPGLNNVTIDGQSIGAPEAGDRRIALDTIPADVLSKLEVIKTPTPDLDGNAIGGTVNLVTPSAFDDEDGYMFNAAADIGYYDLNGENPYGINAGWARVFGDQEQFGILLTASFSQREYRTENVQTDIWEEEDDYYVPGELNMRDYYLERERTGLVANLEWRPSDNTSFYWRNLYTKFEDLEDRIEHVYDYREGDLEDQTPTSGTFTEGEGSRAYKHRLEKQSIAQTTLGGEFLFGATTLELSGTFGKTEQDTPFDIEWQFEVADSLPMTYDTSDLFPRIYAPSDFEDPEFWEFDKVDRNNQIVEEDLQIWQGDLRHDLNFGDSPAYLKGGLKFTSREKTSDQSGPTYDGFEDDLLLSQFSEPGRANFYASVRPGFYTFGPQVDYRAAEAFFASNTGDFEVSSDDTNEAEFDTDYRVDEDVSAAYVMAGVDVGQWTFTGGVRVEKTSSNYSAFEVVFDDGDFLEALPRRGKNSYTDWLPGIIARYQATDNFVVRGGWTNTIGRPAYEQLVPYRIFEYEPNDDDELEGEVEEGNPNLDRLQSSNLDLSFEYYFESGGVIAAGLFWKQIDNPIFSRTESFEEVEYQGRYFAELEITRPENAIDGDIKGYELNYQQQFVNLPSPWNGFGFSLNYTYTDSEADVFDRDDKLPFFLQSDNIANAALFFERAGFEARIAYAYRSEYLDEVGGDSNEDLYIDSRNQLDFKASYAFGDHYRVYLELLNLTDEPLRYISGRKSGRLAENEIYSWNATLGLQFEF
ncbi:MAG: TonB-dependent receptor [Lysobacterales bacterium]